MRKDSGITQSLPILPDPLAFKDYIMKIRREIALRRKELISQGENPNKALTMARQEANKKYGKGWRDDEAIKNYLKVKNHHKPKYEPSIYDVHIHGEHWMD